MERSEVREITINLKVLTVEEVREKYWDPISKTGRCIEYYTFPSHHIPTLPREMYKFTPDGRVLYKNHETRQEYTLNDWLSYGIGPYMTDDAYKRLPEFYIMLGKKENGENTGLQICSGPLNVIATSAINNMHCWVINE